jgi:hypothetical protein
MAIKHEKIIGAIQWTWGGPRLVQENPNSPIVSRGATVKELVAGNYSDFWMAYPITANRVELQAASHPGLSLGLCNDDGSMARMRCRQGYIPLEC